MNGGHSKSAGWEVGKEVAEWKQAVQRSKDGLKGRGVGNRDG